MTIVDAYVYSARLKEKKNVFFLLILDKTSELYAELCRVARPSGFSRKLPDFSGFWIFFIWWITSQLFIYILKSLNDSIELRVLLQFSHTLALTLTLIAAFNVPLSLKVWLNCRRTPVYCEHHWNFSIAFTIRRCSVVEVLLYHFSYVIHYQQ
jgi:hypothetical protein